jgi:hypothetical protein
LCENSLTPQWLAWAREIQAIAQTGDTYAENHWQHERYQRLMEIAAEIDPKGAPMVEVNVLRSPNREEFTRIAFFKNRGYAHRDRGMQDEKDSVITIDSSYSSVLPDCFSTPAKRSNCLTYTISPTPVSSARRTSAPPASWMVRSTRIREGYSNESTWT